MVHLSSHARHLSVFIKRGGHAGQLLMTLYFWTHCCFLCVCVQCFVEHCWVRTRLPFPLIAAIVSVTTAFLPLSPRLRPAVPGRLTPLVRWHNQGDSDDLSLHFSSGFPVYVFSPSCLFFFLTYLFFIVDILSPVSEECKQWQTSVFTQGSDSLPLERKSTWVWFGACSSPSPCLPL